VSELAVHQPQSTDLTEQMRYASTVSTGSLLPVAYRGKPADILIAIGLGQAMGLSPAESLYRIDVIQGKPTASAELIASNVRKAGHILRVRVDETGPSATATIIRADDPDYEHTVVRDAAWAQRMGLAQKPNYKSQPATMLQWRAISGVARMACPEALYGVAYTSDEIDAPRPAPVTPQVSDFAPRGVHDTAPIVDDTVAETEPATRAQVTAMNAAMTARGLTARPDKLDFLTDRIGRPIESSAAVTKDEASALLDALHAEDQAKPADPDADYDEPPADHWAQQEGQA